MPFEIVRNDITKMRVDAIVNTANPRPVIGLGVDSAIHEKAGIELLKARQCIGHIDVGHAAITPAYQLDAKFVIHTAGPVWMGGEQDEEMLLRSCYDSSLQLALQYQCQSVAFPLISSGNYGFPKDKALQIAIAAFSEFLLAHEMQIFLVVFDRTSFRLSEKLFQRVASFVDENYVDTAASATYAAERENRYRSMQRRQEIELRECRVAMKKESACAPAELPRPLSLEEVLKQQDVGFTEALLKRIDDSGKKDSEIYKKANISKQHFSKIRNNPGYKPTKPTAIALALALELDLEQTKDLIGRAGYALTNSSKFDLIIRYFIEQKNYNVVEINIALYEFDQSVLGGKE
ncbi:MAG: macro domain-containing protein [Bacteroidaceae bacterium]|nr:macro domain-containing protein [Bacteroidaceae bacterium]